MLTEVSTLLVCLLWLCVTCGVCLIIWITLLLRVLYVCELLVVSFVLVS